MAQTKRLTQTGLIKTLKKVGVATKSDVKQIVKSEIKNHGLATKNYVKTIVKDQTKNFATKDDVKIIVKDQTKNFATKDDIKNFATKDDIKNLATKDDIKNFATKDDLKNEISGSERRLTRRLGKMEKSLRQSITDLAETTPTRTEFEDLKRYYTPLS